jgi:hypothetical protein
MSLLDTALRFAEYIPEPFVAPVPTDGIVDVFTLQNNVPLKYTIQGQKTGWYEIIPHKRRAVVGRQAWIDETTSYLESLPRFYAINCIQTGDNAWLVVPYNASDASQRGWKNGSPQQVYLVNENIEPFDVLLIRKLAGLFLYDSLDYRLGTFTKSEMCKEALENKKTSPNERDWRNAFNIISEWQAKAEQEARLAKIENQMLNATDKMKFLLEFMGAKLVSSEKKGKGYQVIWEAPNGHTYKTGVCEDGRISVAGFCLAGTDAQHNLSSLVKVIEEAERIERFDINQARADYDDEDWDD